MQLQWLATCSETFNSMYIVLYISVTLTHKALSSRGRGVSACRRLVTTGCTGRCSSGDIFKYQSEDYCSALLALIKTEDIQLYFPHYFTPTAAAVCVCRMKHCGDSPTPPLRWVLQSSRSECRTSTANRSLGSRSLQGPVPLPDLETITATPT